MNTGLFIWCVLVYRTCYNLCICLFIILIYYLFTSALTMSIVIYLIVICRCSYSASRNMHSFCKLQMIFEQWASWILVICSMLVMCGKLGNQHTLYNIFSSMCSVHLTVSAQLGELCQQHAECDGVPGEHVWTSTRLWNWLHGKNLKTCQCHPADTDWK